MVIQRWQSLLLFIAVVLMSIFSVSAYASYEVPGILPESVYSESNIGYYCLNISTAVVLFLSIFLFKKLKIQKALVLIACLMMGASAIWGWHNIHRLTSEGSGVEYHFSFSWILLIVAFGLSVVSFFLICADQKLLKSYDRLR